MQKRKKRFNSLSKLQKGILFFLVLVAVSLIGVVVAFNGGFGLNRFVFLFPSKQENSMKLMEGGSSTDPFMDAEDLTKNLDNPTCLIARNGATKSAEKNKKEGYISQFLHKLFVKNNINVETLDSKIKTQANIDVNIKFYLVPKELQNRDPKDFNETEFQKLLDLDNYVYEADGKSNQKFFGACVVFNDQFHETNLTKKYKFDWLGYSSVDAEVKVKSLFYNDLGKYYLPKDGFLTSKELEAYTKLQNLNNLTNDEITSNYYSSYSGVIKNVKPKSTPNIPNADYICENKKKNEKKYEIYQKDFKYPKLIAKNSFKSSPNKEIYEGLEPLILINFWNETSLCDEFFDEVKKKESKERDYYIDDSHPLTLFTQIAYTLVDNEGNTHTFATDAQGPNLTDIQHENSKADKGGSGQRRIKVTRREVIKGTNEATNINTVQV